MARTFEAGAKVEKAVGFKKAKIGLHFGRVIRVIHLGPYNAEFGGVKKGVFNHVVMQVALLSKKLDDLGEDGKWMQTSKDFPLKDNEKSTYIKLLNILDPEEKLTCWNDLIGTPVTVNMQGGKKKDTDGKPLYVDFGIIALAMEEMWDFIPKLEDCGFPLDGEVLFNELTPDVIRSLDETMEVKKILMQGEAYGKKLTIDGVEYDGTVAKAAVDKIRETEPDFGKKVAKDESGAAPSSPETPTGEPVRPQQLSDEDIDEDNPF